MCPAQAIMADEVGHDSLCRAHFSSPFKRACHFTEGERVAIVDGRGLVGFQALAVDAGGVCAVQVGQRVGAADVLESGVNTRDGVRARYRSKVYLRLDATDVVIVTADHRTLS